MRRKAGIVSLCMCMSLFLMTGCGSASETGAAVDPDTVRSEDAAQSDNSAGDIFTYMEMLNADSGLEAMNQVMGFEAEPISESDTSKTYQWDLGDDSTIKAYFSYYTKLDGEVEVTVTIEADYPVGMAWERADFSKWDDIEAKFNSDEELSYNELVQLLGGVEGKITKKSSGGITYKWVDADNGYVTADLNADTMTCSVISGWF